MRILFFLVTFIPFLCSSQREWALQECVDTAMFNNRAILLVKLQREKAALAFKNDKFSFLPSLNGGVTHGYNFGQTIDPFTNQFATDRVQTDNFYLSSTASLFSGLQSYYNRKILTLDQASEAQNIILAERNQRIEVTTTFLQCLMNQELVILAENNLAASHNELKKTILLIQEGRKTEIEADKVNARIARDEITLRKARNEIEFSFVSLQQIMGLELDSMFKIKNEITLSNIGITSSNPEFNISKINLEKQNYTIKQFKSQYYPKLNLNGSLGTGYSENNQFQNDLGQFEPKPFRTQMNENLYTTVSASISIPIYNNHKTITQVKLAKLGLEQERIKSIETEQEYANQKYKMKLELEQATGDYQAYKIALSYAEKEFQNSELLYTEGRISFYDFQMSRSLFLKATSEEIQSKYKMTLASLIYSIF